MTVLNNIGIARGISLLFIFCLVACSSSPREKLAHVREQLKSLQDTNATFYLQDELAAIHSEISEVEKRLTNEEKLPDVEPKLRAIKVQLKKLQGLYAKRINQAEQESHNFITYVNFHIDSVKAYMSKMPRKTYVDQNRLDIAKFRTQALQQRIRKFQIYISNKDFAKASLESPQIRKSLILLLNSVNIKPVSWQHIQPLTDANDTKVATNSHARFAQ